MSITIRTPADGDFFAWLDLYEGYAKGNGSTLTDQHALVLWSWLSDPTNKEQVLVAVDHSGNLVGLVHFHEFIRPLDADRSISIDDLFVIKDSRNSGVGTALINSVKAIAAQNGHGVVRLATVAENEEAQRFYGEIANRTELVTYEVAPNS